MPHSKTPGGQAASAKHLKQEAEAQGAGALNAPGRTEPSEPGDAPVAGDSYTFTVGIEAGKDRPGEKGKVMDSGEVGHMGDDKLNQGNLK